MAAYKPKRGGYKYNELIAKGHSATRRQRGLIEQIIHAGPSREELYMLLVEITLLSNQVDEAIDGLAAYDDD